jgi:hypothetical protein
MQKLFIVMIAIMMALGLGGVASSEIILASTVLLLGYGLLGLIGLRRRMC